MKRASFAIAFVAATASLGTRFTLADEKLDIVAIVTKADVEKILGVPVKPPQGGNKQGADGKFSKGSALSPCF
jgi:hypothetical protein